MCYLSQTLIIHIHREFSRHAVRQTQRVSRRPGFDLLMMQRGEQKFIHPVHYAIPLSPNAPLNFGASALTPPYPTPPDILRPLIMPTPTEDTRQQKADEQKKRCVQREFKSLTTPRASSWASLSLTLGRLLRSLFFRIHLRT